MQSNQQTWNDQKKGGKNGEHEIAIIVMEDWKRENVSTQGSWAIYSHNDLDPTIKVNWDGQLRLEPRGTGGQ